MRSARARIIAVEGLPEDYEFTLVLDSWSGHTHHGFLQHCLDRGFRVIFVPANTTGLCQVHDVGVIMPVKQIIKLLALAALSTPKEERLSYPMAQIERDCAALYSYSALKVINVVLRCFTRDPEDLANYR